ncbi:Gfo/Idh/MocA family protein [Streptomyces sp. MK37H]|uniref:Gfo/Idh/MocA family protein n=1 Tax=Streptomyces sp. MK37H TaxID=2699117 RepID=UPI001B382B1B|nr:Gfo/Idh/MocA family oxidoreductase [Streptomyces sp. MK37H]MBP8538602.1 Gfo/Idh/MocA family oxidoreductase [Streptomyces sp. MK37H]
MPSPASEPRTPIRVGIVGLSTKGGWAARAHVPALAELDGYELRALSASSAESARAAGEKFGVPLTFGSAGELARSEEVDLVVVTVKVPHHRELILPALEAGKPVLSEWPLGTDLAQAEELVALADARGVRTAVGLQARSAPPLRYLRDLVADGYVGRVLSTTMVVSGRNWGATFREGGEYLLDRANGATMLTIPFGHTADALTMVLGELTDVSATTATLRPQVTHEVTGRTATMTAEDQIAVTGTLESGAVAALHFRGGSSRATDFHWEINGTEGDLVVKADTAALWMGRITLHGARGSDTGLTELPVPASYERLPRFTGRSAEYAYNVAYAYAQLHDDLTTGTRLTPDFAHAVRRHRLLDRVQESARTGARLTVTA